MRAKVLANVAALALPIVLLGTIEVTLRISQRPHRGMLFFRQDGEIRFSSGAAARYFAPRSSLVPEAHSEVFRQPKPIGLFRVVCLGGSTMAGYPFTYNGTLPSLISDRLAAVLPGYKVEVLNLAVSAVGSFTVLDLCRHVVRFQPDAIVVYCGHNEFYGAMGAASSMRTPVPRWCTLLHLRMQEWSLYRVLWDALGRVRPSRPASSFDQTLMARMVGQPCIAQGSQTYRRAIEVFSANLAELCAVCAVRGIPLLVCELVCNLRDQPPFAVCPPAETPPAAEAGAARELTAEELFVRAREKERAGRGREAATLYRLARDADGCRFRAPGVLNDSLRAVVARRGALLVPLEDRFQAASVYAVPGYDLFMDHLHPNLDGYMLIARAVVETMQGSGRILTPEAWHSANAPDESAFRARALVTQLEYAIAYDKIRRLMRHWPFSSYQPLPVYAFDDTLLALADRYHRDRLAWSEVHLTASAYHLRHKNFSAARLEAEAVLKQAVGFWPAWTAIGDAYLAEGNPLDAAAAYRTAARLNGGQGHSLAKIGSALLAGGMAEEAIEVLTEARMPAAGLANLDHARAGYMLGLAYAQSGHRAEASALVAELRRSPETLSLATRLQAVLSRD